MNKYEVGILMMFIITIFVLNWGMFADVEVMLVFSLPTVIVLMMCCLFGSLTSKKRQLINFISRQLLISFNVVKHGCKVFGQVGMKLYKLLMDWTYGQLQLLTLALIGSYLLMNLTRKVYMGTYKRKGTVTISIDELERLQCMDNLTHKQRFTIDRLKRDLNAMTVKASNFSKKTFELLKSLGFTDKAIFEYYKEKPKKEEED